MRLDLDGLAVFVRAALGDPLPAPWPPHEWSTARATKEMARRWIRQGCFIYLVLGWVTLPAPLAATRVVDHTATLRRQVLSVSLCAEGEDRQWGGREGKEGREPGLKDGGGAGRESRHGRRGGEARDRRGEGERERRQEGEELCEYPTWLQRP